ncbi:MAG: DinB family protein [Bacteroidota bacterium]
MKVAKPKLIEELIRYTKDNLNQAEGFQRLNSQQLNWRPGPQQWSILECMDHLNRYGDFYLPEIDRRLQKARPSTPKALFKSGWLGNYFALSMLPKEPLNKMKTFKSMNSLGSTLDKSTLDKFIRQQKRTLDLLDQARTVDWTKTKTSISISNFIKLRLGDTFRVVIYHNVRHLKQAQRVLQAAQQELTAIQ